MDAFSPASRTVPVGARVAVIANRKAGVHGSDAEAATQIARSLADRDLEVQLHDAGTAQDIKATVQKERDQGAAMIVAAGGDGTVNAVASQLAGTDVVLGVAPLGTFNHFAKDLGIPVDDPEAATAVLAEGLVRRVDVAEVNGQVFLNNSSLGLYPRMVAHRLTYQRRGYSKWTAVLRAIWTALPVAPRLHLRLRIDGAADDTRSAFIFLGNNRYTMEGLNAAERPQLDEGALSLYLARGAGPWRVLQLALRAVTGRLRSAGDFEEISALEIIIACDCDALTVAFDGEIATMQSPLTYRIRPRALRVAAPRMPQQQ